MLSIIHALTGGLIGEEFHSLLFIVLASFVMHFLMDMLPHWDGNFDREKFHQTGEIALSRFAKAFFILDMLAALAIIVYMYKFSHNPKIVLGAFAGVLPDLMGLGYKTKLRKNKKYDKFIKFHSKIQKETDWKKSLVIHLVAVIVITAIFVIL